MLATKITASIKITVEIATLTRVNDKTVIRILKCNELEQLIKKYEADEAKSDAEKKKAPC